MQIDQSELTLMIGRLDGKLDAVLSAVAGHTEKISDMGEDLNKLHTRVTVLEARRGAFKEWVAVGFSVFAAIATAYSTFLKGLFH